MLLTQLKWPLPLQSPRGPAMPPQRRQLGIAKAQRRLPQQPFSQGTETFQKQQGQHRGDQMASQNGDPSTTADKQDQHHPPAAQGLLQLEVIQIDQHQGQQQRDYGKTSPGKPEIRQAPTSSRPDQKRRDLEAGT